jgi:carbonic anhydrase
MMMTAILLCLSFLGIVKAALYPIPLPGQCAPWSYFVQDLNGPTRWAKLPCTTTNFCGIGKFQSPVRIDNTHPFHDRRLRRLNFNGYGAANVTLANNGIAAEVSDYSLGSFTNSNPEQPFFMTGFRLQTNADDIIGTNGPNPVISLHLIHNAGVGLFPINGTAIAIVEILFIVDADPTPNLLLQPFVDALSLISVSGSSTLVQFPGFQQFFDFRKGNLTDRYFNFPGSLQTPPCSEEIDWTILAVYERMSQDQYTTLLSWIQVAVGAPLNNRPIQRTIRHVSYYDPLFSGSSSKFGSVVLFLLVLIALF